VGTNDRIRKASSGPAAAPIVSSMRWTPNDLPRFDSSDDVVMRASRGAVRIPLPSRSRAITVAMLANPLASNSQTLVTADSP
jgi:hypothetical protein